MKTKLLVKGYLHKTPIYDREGNWTTNVFIGDLLIVDSGGFGSEMLVYAGIYKVINDNGKVKLKRKGEIINEKDTKNTMPFFLKLSNPPPNDR